MAQVNGEIRPECDGMTLGEVLASRDLDATVCACELNGDIVARDAFESVRLESTDVLEIVRFVGGG